VQVFLWDPKIVFTPWQLQLIYKNYGICLSTVKNKGNAEMKGGIVYSKLANTQSIDLMRV